MTPLSLLATRKKTSVVKLTRNSRIFKSIINAIRDKKGEHIISMDLRSIPEAVVDFFIICEATTSVQVKAISDFVELKLKEECNETPYKHEGFQALQWVLIDYVNIVVHVMQPEIRKFYRLEEMWSDGKMMEHNEGE